MYLLNWHITIGSYSVQTLKAVKITTSVLNLSDTATIEMPGQYLNTWKKIEDKVAVGDAVTIRLGYGDDSELETEFTGYLKRISRDNNSLVLECEDALYLLRKTVADKEYKPANVKTLLSDVLQQVDSDMTVDCQYDYTMEKFVLFKQTALDVVKKIQEETKANIWFEGKVLHIHPMYQNETDAKAFLLDTEVNVQSNELKWIDKSDKKVQVEVVYVNPNGDAKKQTYGSIGGQKVTKYVNGNNEIEMMNVAENEYKYWNYSGYEGSITGWLIPAVRAGECVRLRDKERSEGKYYVTGVEIDFGQSGAKRKITLGKKLA